MHGLFELYGERSADFIQGVIATLEFYGDGTGRFTFHLYGRPITREELELEKQSILDGFIGHEEEIEL